MTSRTFEQQGDEVADVHALGAGLDPDDDPALTRPASGGIARLGIAAQDLEVFLDAQQGIDGLAEQIVDTMLIAESRDLGTAIVTIAPDGDLPLQPD